MANLKTGICEVYLTGAEAWNLATFLREKWKRGDPLTITQRSSSGIGVRTDVRSDKHKEDISDYDSW